MPTVIYTVNANGVEFETEEAAHARAESWAGARVTARVE